MRRWTMALAFALCTAAAALWANRELSSDIWFLLAGGREVASGGIPHRDVFRTLHEGEPWLFQQWLAGTVFHLVHAVVGMAGLEVAYALLLGAALLPLALGCRRRRPLAVAGAFLLAAPTLAAVLDVRAAGFSLLAFSLVIVLVTGDRRTWRIWLLPPLILVWANLHAAFVAGLLLAGLVALGALVDARRGLGRDALLSRRFVAIGLALPAVLGTPLGARIADYVTVLSRNPILPVITLEWQPTIWHPLMTAYVVAVAGFGVLLWRAQPAPRRIEPLLVVLGFCLFALTATRQIVWLGPIAFYAVRTMGRPGDIGIAWREGLLAGGVALAAIGAWLVVDAPRPTEPRVLTPLGDWIATHPPAHGRVVTTTGLGSYLMWRAPDVPIAIDGRLENYSDGEIRTAYALLRGEPSALWALDAWDVSAIATRDEVAVARLAPYGFHVVRREGDGILLERG